MARCITSWVPGGWSCSGTPNLINPPEIFSNPGGYGSSNINYYDVRFTNLLPIINHTPNENGFNCEWRTRVRASIPGSNGSGIPADCDYLWEKDTCISWGGEPTKPMVVNGTNYTGGQVCAKNELFWQIYKWNPVDNQMQWFDCADQSGNAESNTTTCSTPTPPSPTVTGVVFDDVNADGCKDPGEGTITSYTVSPGVAINNITTSGNNQVINIASGQFSASNLISGDQHNIALTGGLPSGYYAISSYAGTDDNCATSSLFRPTGANFVKNIGVSKNISWFNSFDGDVYGSSISNPIPSGSVANNWLINKFLAGAPGAGGVGIARTNISTAQSGTNRTSDRPNANTSAPGWQVVDDTTGAGIAYFSNQRITTSVTRSNAVSNWATLAPNTTYTGGAPETLPANYTVTGGGVATYFYRGNLTINGSLTGNAGGLVIISNGDIAINAPSGPSQMVIDAVLIAAGEAKISGTPDNPIRINGAIYSQASPDLSGLKLSGNGNVTNPALSVYFQPIYLTNTNPELLQTKYFWEELPPQ